MGKRTLFKGYKLVYVICRNPESGKFLSINEMKTTKDGKFDISTVVCQFENGTCQFNFIFDEAGNLKSVVKNFCSK